MFGLIAVVPLLLLASGSHADPTTVPPSLLPGAQYRLAFVTAGSGSATSTNIADYDAFVTGQANLEVSLSSISWQVIGSTATVSAGDHTGTAPANLPGVPIFLLNGVKLVDDYADLWDGTLDTSLGIDQHGNLNPGPIVFTGTSPSGTAVTGNELGSNPVVTGLGSSATSTWIQRPATSGSGSAFRFYALSQILVVPQPPPPVPALPSWAMAAFVAMLAIAVVAGARARARR